MSEVSSGFDAEFFGALLNDENEKYLLNAAVWRHSEAAWWEVYPTRALLVRADKSMGSKKQKSKYTRMQFWRSK